ncbi:MAG: tetratricopeptide repeat protein [Terriglobales bacterium]
MRLAQSLSAKKAHPADTIAVEVQEDVVAPDNSVVISKGAPGYGRVVEAQPARRLGRRGTLTLAIDSVEAVTGERIAVRAEHQTQGESATEQMAGRIVTTAVFVGVGASLWLLKHGNDAELPAGTSMLVFVKQNTPVDLSKSLSMISNQSPLALYQLAFLRKDAPAMEKQLAVAANTHSEDMLLSAASDTEAYYGHLVKARELSQRAADVAFHAGLKESAGIWKAVAALHEAELGNKEEARQFAAAALKLSSNKDVKILAALAFARGGDPKHAQGLSARLHEEHRVDAVLDMYWLPTIDAAAALDHKKPKDALESLHPADTHAMDAPPPLQLGSLYPIYLRGEAMLALHNSSGAAAAFKTVVDHPGIVANFPLGALAHLQLARAYQMQSDTTNACAEYAAFLSLWRDADSGTPTLQQAKREASICGHN